MYQLISLEVGRKNLCASFLRLFLFLLLSLFSIISVIAQIKAPTINVSNCYGGGGLDMMKKMLNTSDGGYVLAGTTMSFDAGDNKSNDILPIAMGDCWIVKAKPDGSTAWKKYIGGTSQESCNSITETPDGGFILVGYTNSLQINGSDVNLHIAGRKIKNKYIAAFANYAKDALAIKLDAQGNIQWIRNYGGVKDDEATSIKATLDGDYIICCNTYSSDGDINQPHRGIENETNIWVIKIDLNGNLKNQYSLSDGDNDDPVDIIPINEKNYFVLARSTKDRNSNNTKEKMWAFIFNERGEIVNQYYPNESNQILTSAAVMNAQNHFVIAGTSTGKKNTSADGYILELDENLKFLSQHTYGGSDEDGLNSLVITGDGGYVMAGTANSNDGDVTGLHPTKDNLTKEEMPEEAKVILKGTENAVGDAWIVKLNDDFEILWQHCYGGSSVDIANTIAINKTGEVSFAGISFSTDGDVKGHYVNQTSSTESNPMSYMFKSGQSDYWLIRLNTDQENICSTCKIPPQYSLNIIKHIQQNRNWCWAACEQMILEYYGIKLQQCEIANNFLNQTSCCLNKNSEGCSQQGLPHLEKYGFSFKRTKDYSALSWEEIKCQIACYKSPIFFTTISHKPYFSTRYAKYYGDFGHGMVIIGYYSSNAINYLIIIDPMEGVKKILYDDYITHKDVTHGFDYYNFKK